MNQKQQQFHDKIAHALDTVLNIAFVVACNIVLLAIVCVVAYRLTRWFLS